MNIVKTTFNCEVLDIKSVRDGSGNINYDVCDIVMASNHDEYKSFYGTTPKGMPKPVVVRVEREDAQQLIIGQTLCYQEMNVMISAQEDEHVMETKGYMPLNVRREVAKVWDELTEEESREVRIVHSETLSPTPSSYQGVSREVVGIDYTSRHMRSEPTSFAKTPTEQ